MYVVMQYCIYRSMFLHTRESSKRSMPSFEKQRTIVDGSQMQSLRCVCLMQDFKKSTKNSYRHNYMHQESRPLNSLKEMIIRCCIFNFETYIIFPVLLMLLFAKLKIESLQMQGFLSAKCALKYMQFSSFNIHPTERVLQQFFFLISFVHRYFCVLRESPSFAFCVKRLVGMFF